MLAPQTDSNLHQEVSVADILVLGGLVDNPASAWAAITHGKVRIEQWTISLHEGTLPRWALRGVVITIGERSLQISDDGTKILREPTGTLV